MSLEPLLDSPLAEEAVNIHDNQLDLVIELSGATKPKPIGRYPLGRPHHPSQAPKDLTRTALWKNFFFGEDL